MGNVKDEGKKMDPLFPRLHISDAEKGGPRPPPRNKMALSQQLLPLSTNNCRSFVPTTSSYHDASYKRSVFSPFGSSSGSTRLATRLDSYHSGGMNLNISLTTVNQTIETTNCQTLCNVGHLKPTDYCLFKPQGFTNTSVTLPKNLEDEDDYLVPNLPLGQGQHNTNRGKVNASSTKSHLKLPIACQNQLKPSKDFVKEPAPYYSNRIWISETLSREHASSNPKKRSNFVDESNTMQDSSPRLQLKRRFSQENMTCGLLPEAEDATRKMSFSAWPSQGDDHKTDGNINENVTPINNNEEDDHGSLQLVDMGKTGDISEVNSVSGFNISPEEVARLIGQEQYCKARRTMIQQQRVFALQLFELHRLVKVQKLIAKSPELLQEDSLYRVKKMPSKEIFPKIESWERNSPLKPLRVNNDTDGRYSYRPNCRSDPVHPPPPSTASAAKQPPWSFIPPAGNQWLVPIKSPSEGLIYKPYTGPCPPPAALMAPIYGMSLTPPPPPPLTGDFLAGAYSIAASFQQGIGVFPSNQLYTPYEENINYSKATCNILTPEKLAISAGVQNLQDGSRESDLQGSSGSSSSERKKGGDELPLFPTAPVFQDSDQDTEDKASDQMIKVIKVVPHNPKLASESAARIFQFIQEERKKV